MFNPKDKLDRTLMKISLYVILTFAIAYAISRILYYVPSIMKWIVNALSIMLDIIAPLIYGLVIAYLLWPLVIKIKKFLFNKSKKNDIKNEKGDNNKEHIGHLFNIKNNEKKNEVEKNTDNTERWKTGISIFISYIIILGMVVLLISVTYAAIAEKFMNFEFNGVIDMATEYVKRYENKINEISTTIANLEVPDNIKDQLLTVTKYASNAISDFGTGLMEAVKSISKNVMNLLIGLIISFYLILDSNFFKGVWNKFLTLFMKKKKRNKVNAFLTEINVVLSNFVRGQLLDCFIVSIISVIALLIVNIDFAVILGIFAGIANIIPYFGPVIGMVPAAIIGILSGEPLKALFAIIALTIIQQIDGNIIAPRIVGGSVGVHPVFVIISILIGAYFWGIIGMIIAVPVCGVVKVILTKILINKEKMEEREN